MQASNSQINGVDLDRYSDNYSRKSCESKASKKKFSLIKTIMRLTFSNVGLVTIVVIYTCLGALMFRLLEQHEELRLCEAGKGKLMKTVQELKDDIVSYVLYNVTNIDLNTGEKKPELKKNISMADAFDNYYIRTETENGIYIGKLNESNIIDLMLKDYRNEIHNIDSKFKYRGQDCVEDTRWTFSSALLFSLTVISTIGYGHVTPITWEGQIVCGCYATIGIPIFLMCLANISGSLGEVFKFVYTKCGEVNPFKKRNRRDLNRSRSTSTSNQLNFSNIDILLSTHYSNNSEKNVEILHEKILKELSFLNTDEDLVDDDDDEDLGVQVPSLVTIIFIVFYISIGAYIFQYFENWTFVESVYFIYVSFTTIGFGDFVPGQKTDDRFYKLKLTFVTFYLTCGMAILGMGFGLMQGAAKNTIMKGLVTVKRFLSPVLNHKAEEKMSESEREKEKQDIVNKIKFLKDYEALLRQRNVAKKKSNADDK